MASRRLFDGAQVEIGSLPIVGAGANPGVALTATEDADTAAFTVGIVSANPTVSLDATEGPDVAAFTVANRLGVTLGATEGADTAAFAVGVVSATPAVSLGATEGADVAAFAVVGPAQPSTGGGAGDYFTYVPNFAQRWTSVRKKLEEAPTAEVVREAARIIVQSAEPDLEPNALRDLVAEQLRTYDLLASLLAVAQEEARREQERIEAQRMIEQDEAEVQHAIRLFAEYLA